MSKATKKRTVREKERTADVTAGPVWDYVHGKYVTPAEWARVLARIQANLDAHRHRLAAEHPIIASLVGECDILDAHVLQARRDWDDALLDLRRAVRDGAVRRADRLRGEVARAEHAHHVAVVALEAARAELHATLKAARIAVERVSDGYGNFYPVAVPRA